MNKPGLVYINGGFRPFTDSREIHRGRNTGAVEIRIRKLTNNNGFKQIKRIVTKNQISRYPK